ncbi:hypothetical protein [Bradyrhizobium japonicum]|uniref:hypothetical protein n=1 Tax=Bradyrhizobium japonicum TaxID=375 RepID=UPI002715295A|nr:hypothetical protein [Bradyrhizobium japonicum]WLB24476.1 hypothetical protein QIH95_50925 [Bradyrhizobium japonicum]
MEVEEEELSLDGQLQGLIDAVDLARDERSIRNAIKKFAVSSVSAYFTAQATRAAGRGVA